MTCVLALNVGRRTVIAADRALSSADRVYAGQTKLARLTGSCVLAFAGHRYDHSVLAERLRVPAAVRLTASDLAEIGAAVSSILRETSASDNGSDFLIVAPSLVLSVQMDGGVHRLSDQAVGIGCSAAWAEGAAMALLARGGLTLEAVAKRAMAVAHKVSPGTTSRAVDMVSL